MKANREQAEALTNLCDRAWNADTPTTKYASHALGYSFLGNPAAFDQQAMIMAALESPATFNLADRSCARQPLLPISSMLIDRSIVLVVWSEDTIMNAWLLILRRL